MRTIQFRSLSLAAFALLAIAASAAAQGKSPAPLSALEVQRLITSTAPADHARLSVHFGALADQYTAEAKRHTAMSRSAVGNPSRNLGTSLSAHCTRLAALNTESATALRELATHHKTLAAGAPSVAPPDTARFEAGVGAPKPTDQDLEKLAATAHTPADHQALEAYFLKLATEYTDAVRDHTAMARAYRGLPRDLGSAQAVHCERLVTLSREEAKEANAAVVMHKNLAGAGR